MRILGRTILLLLLVALAAAPALAAGKDLEATPQGKAYRALLKTVAAGDYEGYKKAMTAEAARGMDAQLKEMKMGSKEAMAMLKMMSPADIKLTDRKVAGKKAVLTATGKSDAETNYGTIELAEESGQWKVVKQSWTNKKP